MKTESPRYPASFVSHRRLLFIIGVFVALVILATVPFLSTAASFDRGRALPSSRGLASEDSLAGRAALATTALPSYLTTGRRPGLLAIPSAPLVTLAATVETFAADCVTPQDTFDLGADICAVASAGTTSGRITWSDPSGFVRQTTPITSDPQTDHFLVPTTPTSTLSNGLEVTNLGTWRVTIFPRRGAPIAFTTFVVKDPNNATADLSVNKRAPTSAENVSAGSSGSFNISVLNSGPDTAQAVVLTDVVPNDTTFVSMIQTSGPTFSCTTPSPGGTGTVTCTRPSLARGDSATFDFAYTVNAGTAAGTLISNTATISSSTSESNSFDNSSTAYASVVSSGGGGGTTCSVACPDDITVQANTTENNQDGAIVHFSPPTGNAECGPITVDHCNDCFFPVGTTVVNATATGDSCSFTVTVTAAGAPTITCPPNKDADTAANDTSCEATVDAGTPTTTGDNVTVTGSRSDGRPLSDPYPLGVTTITWTATAHDSLGNETGNASCQQTITVHDKTAPHITCPANKTSGTDPGSCSATVDPGTATATDNCDSSPTVTGTRSDGQVLTAPYPKGTTTITWTATDDSGNSSSCTQTITVNDTEAPTITCPASITTNTEPGTCCCACESGNGDGDG